MSSESLPLRQMQGDSYLHSETSWPFGGRESGKPAGPSRVCRAPAWGSDSEPARSYWGSRGHHTAAVCWGRGGGHVVWNAGCSGGSQGALCDQSINTSPVCHLFGMMWRRQVACCLRCYLMNQLPYRQRRGCLFIRPHRRRYSSILLESVIMCEPLAHSPCSFQFVLCCHP